ncbi:MAG: pseudouridine synthase [Bacteroidales bacterium]
MKQHRHIILHKPAGYLSQLVTHQQKQNRKRLLNDLHEFPDDIMVVGRLDYYSEGLLLLTTDGRLSNYIRSKRVEKEYYTEVDGKITDDAIARLKEGIDISINGSKYTTLPCQVKRLEPPPQNIPPLMNTRVSRHRPTSWVSITITEGKFRQVRKMTAAAGFPTLRLIRARIGNIWLHDLPPGEIMEVDEFELNTSS